MASVGMRPHEIAYLLVIPVSDIMRDYANEYHSGRAKANFNVAATAYQVATDKAHPSYARIATLWLASRNGWSDTAGGLNDVDEAMVAADRVASESDLDARFSSLVETFTGRK